MVAESPDLFDKIRLPPEIDAHLRETNPWWQGLPGRVLPQYRRWIFASMLRKLDAKVAPAIVLRGARQVGKTTLQEQTIQFLLTERRVDPRRIFRVQFDELPPLRGLKTPILDIVRWYQDRILGRTLNQAAHAGEPAYVFLDEVQNLRDWAPQLKALVDHHTVQVVVTGSSALRIEAGRTSLAGRVASLELGTRRRPAKDENLPMQTAKPSERKEIRRMVRRIVARFQPERIILFGSHARGDAGPDSDVILYARGQRGDRAGTGRSRSE